jgi:hypothetical protein
MGEIISQKEIKFISLLSWQVEFKKKQELLLLNYVFPYRHRPKPAV